MGNNGIQKLSDLPDIDTDCFLGKLQMVSNNLSVSKGKNYNYCVIDMIIWVHPNLFGCFLQKLPLRLYVDTSQTRELLISSENYTQQQTYMENETLKNNNNFKNFQ